MMKFIASDGFFATALTASLLFYGLMRFCSERHWASQIVKKSDASLFDSLGISIQRPTHWAGLSKVCRNLVWTALMFGSISVVLHFVDYIKS